MIRAFPDTNVLLYAFETGPKRNTARNILEAGGVISVQSLNEFTSVARRKLGYEWSEIHDAITALLTYLPEVVPLDLVLQGEGIRLAERYKLSVYDAMIVAAALIAGCDTLYSEDMHDGLVIDGRLKIVNPFA